MTLSFTDVSTGRYGDVPKYKYISFVPKKNKYCVCVFVYNEGKRIRAQLQKMQTYHQDVDIIVVDGNSTDGALDHDYLQACGVRALLVRLGSGKLSAQMRMGFDFALNQGYEGIIVMDGNNKDNPEALPRFAESLAAGFDHVQGSRFVPGGHEANTPLERKLGLKLVHAPLIRLSAGFPYTDTTNGFRAYSQKLLLDERVQPFRSVFSQYEMHYYLAIRAARLGFKIKEIPVERVYPKGEKTPTKIKGLKGNMLILKTLWKAVTHKFDPK